MSVGVEVVFHLRLPNHARDVGAVLIPAAQHGHGPVRAAYPAVYPAHAAEVNVGFQTGQARQRLDALDEQLAELRRSASWFCHFSSISPAESGA